MYYFNYFFYQKMAEESLFIIRNDIGEKYKINENDSESVRNFKKTQQQRLYAIYDKDKKMWSMKLPYWFVDSTNPNKCIQIESVSYYKPDGTADIGTTFHSPTLFDGTYNQFDYMVGLCSVGIYRTFRIGARCQTIDFFFRDYMDDENLGDTEVITEQKTDENGELLYYNYEKTEDKYVTNETNEDCSTNEPYVEQLQTKNGEDLYWYFCEFGNDNPMYVMEKSNKSKDINNIYPLCTREEKFLRIKDVAELTTEKTKYPAVEWVTDKNGNRLYYSHKVKDMQFAVTSPMASNYPVMKWLTHDGELLYYDESCIEEVYPQSDYWTNTANYKHYIFPTDFFMNVEDTVINRYIDTLNNIQEKDLLGPLTYHVVNESDEHLFIKKGGVEMVESTEESNYPVTRKVDKPICFIIFTKLIY